MVRFNPEERWMLDVEKGEEDEEEDEDTEDSDEEEEESVASYRSPDEIQKAAKKKQVPGAKVKRCIISC